MNQPASLKSSLRESFSTRATSLTGRTISTEQLLNSPTSKECKLVFRIESILQPIPETEVEQIGSISRNSMNVLRKGASSEESRTSSLLKQKSSSSIEDNQRKTYQGSSPEIDLCEQYFKQEENNQNEISQLSTECPIRYDGYSILRGNFVVGVHDNKHLNNLKTNHSSHLFSLIKNFVPVYLVSDLETHKMKTSIPLILDYLDSESTQPNSKSQSFLSVPTWANQDILHLGMLPKPIQNSQQNPPKKRKSLSMSINQSQLGNFLTKKVNMKKRRNGIFLNINIPKIRASSNEKKKIKIQSDTDKLILSLNLDPLKINAKEEEKECFSPEIIKLEKEKSQIEQSDNVIFKECCNENYQKCNHQSRVGLITQEKLISTAFGTENTYYITVLIITYSKIYQNHSQLLRDVMDFYFSEFKNPRVLKQIITHLSSWFCYKQLEILNDLDDANLLNQIQLAVEKALLLNFGKSQKLNKLLKDLLRNIKNLRELKKSFVVKQNKSNCGSPLQQPTLKVQRTTSVHESSKRDIYKQTRKGQPSQFFSETNDLISGVPEKLLSHNENLDWVIYIDAPAYVLQRQLWLIDIKLYMNIKMSDLLQYNGHSENNWTRNQGLIRIARHFNILLYHMLYAAIICPQQLRGSLFSKLIHLSSLAMQAQHLQLTYLLHCYFSHDITQGYLKPAEHLSYTSQKQLQVLMNFVHRRRQYIFQKVGFPQQQSDQIPCLCWIQSELHKIEVSSQLHINKEGKRFINFAKLELQASLVNSLLQLQRKTSSLGESEYQKLCDQPYNEFFTHTYRSSLLLHSGAEKESQIEVELFKLRNKLRQ